MHESAGASGHEPCGECTAGGQAASGASSVAGAEAGGAPSEAGAASDDAGSAATAGAEAAGAGAVVGGVTIAEVSFWQAFRVPLEIAGKPVAPNAPIITGKDSILRVFVAPDAKFLAHSLSAVLELAGSAGLVTLESKKAVRAASSNGEFGSTFNFPLEPAQVAADTTYSVTLSDITTGDVLDRYPARDRAAVGAVSASPSNRLEIVLVPITVGGLSPDVSAEKIAIFRTRVRSMYPVAEIAISVHAKVSSALEVGPDTGWDALLDVLYALRASDAPPANVYYYGLFTPQPSFDDYCTKDCTVGLSIVADEDDVDSRGSVGLGIFADGSNADAPDTMAHELGHALGRQHAPCSISKANSGPFPYAGGKIGVWGFDTPNHKLLDPALYGDVMGYCSPDWISDFTYRALFQRIASVNGELTTKSLAPAQARAAYQRVLLGADGALHWGARFTPTRVPGGATRPLSLLGSGGQVRATLAVPWRRLADRAGGVLLVPVSALSSAPAAIRVGSAELALPAP